MAKRILRSNSSEQAAIENALTQYDPFIVAHLIKFEKPIGTSKGQSKNPEAFSYITDNSYDLIFDDGTSKVDGTPVGDKIYRANKILNIGTVNENIIAKATGMTVVLDAAALSTQVVSTGAFKT